MCRLMAAVRPCHSATAADGTTASPQHIDEEYKLVSFSSTGTWLCHDQLVSWDHFQAPWIDTMVLGVVAHSAMSSGRWSSHRSVDSVLASGFIGRLGSNCPYGTQAITIPRLERGVIDFDAARGWIARCGEEHSRQCNPRRRAPVPYFRLIECATKKIIEPGGSVPPYVALSYVWGPPPPLGPSPPPSAVSTERGPLEMEGAVEPVVQDAMRVAVELGYGYLWVDRYCIAQEGNESVKQEQLRSMHLVYANAEATLVATAGKDPSSGLPGATAARPRAAQLSACVKGHALACIPPDPAQQIRSSTWAGRGWTYQEGLLARRRLFFSDREMSYECRDLLCREAIRLPGQVQQLMAHAGTRLMGPSWIYERQGVTSSSAGGSDLFDRLAEYTTRRLTYQSDALNAMLGILQVFAERKRTPTHHLCGVPVLRATESAISGFWGRSRPQATGDDDKADSSAGLALAGFVNGLCWNIQRPAERRPGFPSWSWTGWQGVVKTRYAHSDDIFFTYGFDVELSVVRKDGTTVPWRDYYYRLVNAKDKDTSRSDLYFSQNQVLEITADVVTARFREDDDAVDDDDRWKGTVCVGDGIWEGWFSPTRKDSASSDPAGAGADASTSSIVGPGLRRRLLDESWLGIVLGNTLPPDREANCTFVLVVEEQQASAAGAACTYWERVGILQLRHSTLESGILERRTLRLM